ncbi:serine/arginine repetitive matrix protein 2-like [Strigops habroptila]|uniref:serine/arginine repetitive matrix protein 2-like n=1 Tax=Strigops habroptila TaxID=2489341 RepID=UPI0011CFE545|nr:serine/arginine repetitive matrix protein 2-like [Strigops habroptila]
MREICGRRGLQELSLDAKNKIPAPPTSSGTKVLLPAAPQRLRHRNLLCQADLQPVTQQRPHPAPCPEVSFCWEHRPQQQEEVAPEKTTCLICLDPVEGRTTYGTMVCPACKHAWFHRACIQGQALRSGIFCIQCPLCRNRNWFLVEMFNMGIRIPFRPPSWDDNNAYAELNERHRRCDARECLCPGGRSVAEEEGPWQLFLCCSCAAEGTHRHCSSLGYSHWVRWECDSCAGPSTSSGATSELAGPSTTSPAASGWSPASVELDSSSPSTSRQAASGQTLGPPAEEFNSPRTSSPAASGPSLGPPGEEFNSPSTSSQATSGQTLGPLAEEFNSPRTASPAASGQSVGPSAEETSSPSNSGQMLSGPCHSSPVHEGSSHSSCPGPDRRRNATRISCQTQTPYTRPRRQRERSRPPAPCAESSTRSQAVPGLSRCSPAREIRTRCTSRQQPSTSSRGSRALERSRSSRSTVPVRVRDRSRLQRRDQTPYIRPRRLCESSRVPAAQAERSPRSQAVPRLSQRPPGRESRRRSTSRQRPSTSSFGSAALEGSSNSRSTGPAQVRDRSPLQRRDQTPSTRRKRRRERSRTPGPRAKRCTSRQAVLGRSQRSPARATSSSSSESQESSDSSCSSQESESSSSSTDSQEAL